MVDDSASMIDSSHGSESRMQPNHLAEVERQIFSTRETRAVCGLRIMVFLLLATTTVLVSVGVGVFTRRDEQDDFEKQFYGYAGRIVDNFDKSLMRRLAAFDTAAVAFTSHSISTGSKFPNVTLPHIEIRGANTRISADTLYYQWLPLVTDETRLGWEAYAAENEKWLDNAFFSENDQKARQDARFNLTPPERRELLAAERGLQLDGYRSKIYGSGEDDPSPAGSGPYFVYWQMTPIMPAKPILNYNVLSHPLGKAPLLKMVESGKAVLDRASNLLEVEGTSADTTKQIVDFYIANAQYRHDIKEYEGSPLSSFVYPVFDNFAEDRKVAGALFSNVRQVISGFETLSPHLRKGILERVLRRCSAR